MIMNHTLKSSRMRAAEALEILLCQTSATKLRKMEMGVAGRSGEIDIVAHIDVLGRGYVVACQITDGGDAAQIKEALESLRRWSAHLEEKAIPVVVVPHLTPEARALCREGHAGCLDMQGSGSLAFGEIFISVRSTPCRASQERMAIPAQPRNVRSGSGVLKRYSPARVSYPAVIESTAAEALVR
jgi:hypothetical protein